MRTVTGIFGNSDAAETAAAALRDAGVASDDITIDSSGDSDEVVLGARVENEVLDAAYAIFTQSGAMSVEEVKSGFEADGEIPAGGDDVEAEERSRFEEPIPLAIAPIPR